MIAVLTFSALFVTTARARTLIDPRPEHSSTLFGRAIAVIADLDNDRVADLVVGAPFQDGDFLGARGFGPPQNVGKVYVVSGRTLDVITQLDDPKFQMEHVDKFGGQFGSSIAVTRDINGDRVPDILVGLPHHIFQEQGEEERKFNAGRAILFGGKNGNVLLTLDDPDPAENARLGLAVAGCDDVNSDGVPDLLVAAPFKRNFAGFAEVGIVYIFSGKTGEFLRAMTPPSYGSPQGGRFGATIANIGDITNDGVADILIGAPGRSRAFVFDGRIGALLLTLSSPVDEKQASFGSAVAGGKDLNGDGTPDFAIGAPLQNDLRGVVYTFSGKDGTRLHTLRAPDREPSARFGAAVVLSEDITDDGRPDILVGAPDQDVNGLINAGKVFIFSGANGKLFKGVTSSTPQTSAGFGYSLAAADFDGDGIANLVVGAPFQNVDLVASDGDIDTHLQIGQIELKQRVKE